MEYKIVKNEWKIGLRRFALRRLGDGMYLRCLLLRRMCLSYVSVSLLSTREDFTTLFALTWHRWSKKERNRCLITLLNIASEICIGALWRSVKSICSCVRRDVHQWSSISSPTLQIRSSQSIYQHAWNERAHIHIIWMLLLYEGKYQR